MARLRVWYQGGLWYRHIHEPIREASFGSDSGHMKNTPVNGLLWL
jgi:hypothetical protein